MKVLVIEDDYGIQELLRYNLENNQYSVLMTDRGDEGYELAIEEMPDIILLDLMIPGMDGLEVCKNIRANERIKNIPIIMLTAKGEELDKILGLELGADDYITKPFSVKELIARIRSIMRRVERENQLTKANITSDKKIVFGELEIDCEKYEVKVKGQKVTLTFKEFELLKILVQNPGRVMTRDFLLDYVWGYEYAGETRTIDVHIRNLRRKLWGDQDKGMIQTIRGVGYKFDYIGG